MAQTVEGQHEQNLKGVKDAIGREAYLDIIREMRLAYYP